MNTHIIIPIKEIEKIYKIKDTFKRAVEFNKILQGARQISLDEKDIEEKAAKQMTEYYSKENNPKVDDKSRITQRLGAYIGYIQALKDLL